MIRRAFGAIQQDSRYSLMSAKNSRGALLETNSTIVGLVSRPSCVDRLDEFMFFTYSLILAMTFTTVSSSTMTRGSQIPTCLKGAQSPHLNYSEGNVSELN